MTHTHTHTQRKQTRTWKTALTFEVSTGWFRMSNNLCMTAGERLPKPTNFQKFSLDSFFQSSFVVSSFKLKKNELGNRLMLAACFASVNEMNGIILKLNTSLMSSSAESGQVAKYHVPTPILTKTTILFNVCSLANSLSHSFRHMKHTHTNLAVSNIKIAPMTLRGVFLAPLCFALLVLSLINSLLFFLLFLQAKCTTQFNF